MERGKKVATDSELISAVAGGDAQAGGVLAAKYRGPLLKLAARLLRNVDDANDAVQETMLKALSHLPEFDPSRPLRPWLTRICVNCCVDITRRRRMHPEVPELRDAPAPAGPDEMIEELHASMRHRRLIGALQALPGVYGRILYMRHFEGKEVIEIATELRRPEGTVKSWLFRGRALLRKQLLSVGMP